MKDWLPDRAVLLVIVLGLVGIMMAIVIGIFNAPVGKEGQSLVPNWAENVLVALATGSLLKLGDAIGALVTLAGGKTTERLGQQLAGSTPAAVVPADAAQAAQQTADAAQTKADQIGDLPEPNFHSFDTGEETKP